MSASCVCLILILCTALTNGQFQHHMQRKYTYMLCLSTKRTF